MKLNSEQIMNHIILSLNNDIDSWDDCGYWLTNEKLDCRLWVANGVSHITISKLSRNEVGILKPSFLSSVKFRFVYLKKMKKIPYTLTSLFYLLLVLSTSILALFMIYRGELIGNSIVDKIDFNLDKSLFREERLKNLLTLKNN